MLLPSKATSLKRRLFLPFVIFFTFNLVILILTSIVVTHLTEENKYIEHVELPLARDLDLLNVVILETSLEQKDWILSQQPEVYERLVNDIQFKLSDAINNIHSRAAYIQQKTLFQEIYDGIQDYSVLSLQVAELVKRGELSEARNIYLHQLEGSEKMLRQDIQKLLEGQDALKIKKARYVNASSIQLLILLPSSMALVIFISIFLAVRNYKALLNSILQLRESARSLILFNQKMRVKDTSVIEVNSLAADFNELVDQRLKIERELSKRNDELQHMVNFDSLTGLPNRQTMLVKLNSCIERLDREKNNIIVAVIDIQNMSVVNDLWGEEVGDAFLRDFSQQIKKFPVAVSFCCRLYGDCFGLFFVADKDKDVSIMAEQLVSHISYPLNIMGVDLAIVSAVGIAICPDHAADAEDLIKYATICMRQAKEMGENKFLILKKKSLEQITNTLIIKHDLPSAIRNGDFTVCFQPQYHLASEQLIGFEALARWKHPTLGDIPPSKFILAAEQGGHVTDLSALLFDLSCNALKQWHELCGVGPKPRLAFNASLLDLLQHDYYQMLARIMMKYGLPHSSVEIEVTESIAMYQPRIVASSLNKLADAGFSVAVDDFGTGYSSLSRIRLLPISLVKIDKCFVDNIECDKVARQFMKSILSMAKALDLKTLAEGVESQEQLDILTEYHCDFVQGYFLGKPMSKEDALALVDKHYSKSRKNG